ncbi:MAG: CDP-alcohol phosphatidyltransferase family protein [Bacteroidales bacterium]|nr:CDP-alcohol phosphatidyltransferase family protein [Bacteroidales bacterium]
MTDLNRQRYLQTLKHPDTEETIDLWFYRPVGFRLALLGEKLHWTPNMISVLSIFLGIGCGVLCYPADWRWNLVGIALLVMADICDSADGQLARMTRQYSRLGRILDGASGDLWFIAIYLGICFRLFPEWGIWIFILAATAGFCHSKQAQLADCYRNTHLFFARGKIGSEWDDSQQIVDEYRSIRFAEAPLYKVFMWFYKNYTSAQEAMTPHLQQFRGLLRGRYADSPVDPDLCSRFREQSKPLMKYTNILTFNCRAIVLFVTLMIGMPWLYFVVELTLGNVLLLYMWVCHERLCRDFAKELTSDSQFLPD